MREDLRLVMKKLSNANFSVGFHDSFVIKKFTLLLLLTKGVEGLYDNNTSMYMYTKL